MVKLVNRLKMAAHALLGNQVMSSDNIGMELLFGTPPASSGANVTLSTALRVTTALACVRILTSVPSSIGMIVEERQGKFWVGNPDHRLNDFLDAPAPGFSQATFLDQLGWRLHAQGNGLARVWRNGGYDPVYSQPLDRSNVIKVARGTDRRLKYWLSYVDLTGRQVSEVVDQDFVIHVAGGVGFDGLWAPSPIENFGREAIGTAIAAGEYQGRMFSNGGRPSGMIEVPNGVSKEVAENLRAEFSAQHAGLENVHKTGLMWGGAKFTPTNFTAQEAEILATRTHQVPDVARIWGVPLTLVGADSGSGKWGNGVVEEVIGFVKFVLAPHLVRVESEMTAKLIRESERRKVRLRFPLAELMRGTPEQQAKVIETLVAGAGVMSRNEGRALIGMPPKEGGDELMTPRGSPDAETKKEEPSE